MNEMVKYYYEGDQDLLDKYHILAPTDLESACNDTSDAIDICHASGGVSYFRREWYATIYNRHLFAWCIKPEFRKSHKQEFIDFVKQKCDTIAIYKRNERANLFLIKNGFIFVKEVQPNEGENYLIFKCQ